ncbi:hypothetical protein [Legionella parisiensis]|uniref:Transglutaminase-like domain-containing protein n=1 Tax=Legionella parisiensis TaxID=45071 RepID=A0A1E5JUL9_9GAMM|nr:hypothetical protein [Legionella parisiensis]KTD43157.1 hypothetical protein Lpar_1134 [Legionella parisiensis]OEH48244.1 hypothetical protein lpari_00736 [Legionella parisiensis]STX77762.1 Uncharacterised protein [Legionella parisiensis]
MPSSFEIIKDENNLNNAEQDQAGTPIQPLAEMNRTKLAFQHHYNRIKMFHGAPCIKYQDGYSPIVTRDVRNFNQRVFSIGSSSSREMLLLDPEAESLKKLYAELRQNIKQNATTPEILQEISKLTQKAFPISETAFLKAFVEKHLREGNPVIPLDEFMQAGIGICRHHSLLNAFLMSRLVEDSILQGEVIHQRHSFHKHGAHTWNLFRDTKDGKLYSLDSLWKNVTSLADNPGDLNKLYGLDVESGIKAAFGTFQLPSKQKVHVTSAEHKVHAAPSLPIIPEPVPALNRALMGILCEKNTPLIIQKERPQIDLEEVIKEELSHGHEPILHHNQINRFFKPADEVDKIVDISNFPSKSNP